MVVLEEVALGFSFESINDKGDESKSRAVPD